MSRLGVLQFAGQAVLKAASKGAFFPLKKRDTMLDYTMALMADEGTGYVLTTSKSLDSELLHTQVKPEETILEILALPSAIHAFLRLFHRYQHAQPSLSNSFLSAQYIVWLWASVDVLVSKQRPIIPLLYSTLDWCRSWLWMLAQHWFQLNLSSQWPQEIVCFK